MSDEDFFDSGERLLNADELAECVTRQKTFSLPVIGQKVKQLVNPAVLKLGVATLFRVAKCFLRVAKACQDNPTTLD
jgi:hypothetical protein